MELDRDTFQGRRRRIANPTNGAAAKHLARGVFFRPPRPPADGRLGTTSSRLIEDRPGGTWFSAFSAGAMSLPVLLVLTLPAATETSGWGFAGTHDRPHVTTTADADPSSGCWHNGLIIEDTVFNRRLPSDHAMQALPLAKWPSGGLA